MASTPDLKIPAGGTVTVRVVDVDCRITLPAMFTTPIIKGMENFTRIPSFSFLVEHPSGRKLVFDLGVRKDWESSAPSIVGMIKQLGWTVETSKNVEDVLEEHGVSRKSIEAVVWSHWHWDHTGDPSAFPPETALVVGPGFKAKFMPGYPVDPESKVLDSDFAGREVREIAFTGQRALAIGRFDAFDYFGDGSFYLLDAPGHTTGHLNALARVTADPPSFVFMGGDSAHHAGEFRPSALAPLPDAISPHPLAAHMSTPSPPPCPGALFEPLLRAGDRTKAFYTPTAGFNEDAAAAEVTIAKMQEADASPRVLTVIAHDTSLLGKLDVFPASVNDFAARGLGESLHWAFLGDFREAVGLPQ